MTSPCFLIPELNDTSKSIPKVIMENIKYAFTPTVLFGFNPSASSVNAI